MPSRPAPRKRLTKREREERIAQQSERNSLQAILEEWATEIAYAFMFADPLWKVRPLDSMTDVEWSICLDGLACIYRHDTDPAYLQAYQIGDLARTIMIGAGSWHKKMLDWAEDRAQSRWGKAQV